MQEIQFLPWIFGLFFFPFLASLVKNPYAHVYPYSFGITLWEIVTREKPFAHHTDSIEFCKAGVYYYPAFFHISHTFVSGLRQWKTTTVAIYSGVIKNTHE